MTADNVNLHSKHQRLIPFKAEMRQALINEKKRTGINHHKLFAKLIQRHPSKPDGLTIELLGQWLAGTPDQVDSELLEFVMTIYCQQPTRPQSSANRAAAIPLTTEMINALKAEINRTQVTPRALVRRMKKSQHSTNPAISAEKIYRWLRRGGAMQVDPGEYERILAGYRALADQAFTRIPLTEVMRNRFEAERLRTGLGGQGILSRADYIGMARPDNLTAGIINSWMDVKTRTVRDDHFAWVMDILDDAPSR